MATRFRSGDRPMSLPVGDFYYSYEISPRGYVVSHPAQPFVDDLDERTIHHILMSMATATPFTVQIGAIRFRYGFPPQNALRTVMLGHTLWQIWKTFQAVPFLDSDINVRVREAGRAERMRAAVERWPVRPVPRWYSHRVGRRTYRWGFPAGQDPSRYFGLSPYPAQGIQT